MIAEDNPTPPTTAPRLNFRTTGVGWVERTRCFTDAGEELAPNLNFPARDWAFRHREFIAAAALPLVFVPALPDTIPAELLALPHDSKIVIRREISRYDVLAKAGVVMAEVAESIERHKQGLYTAREVAFMLEKQGGARSNRENLFSMVADAAASGELVTVDPDECMPSKPGRLAFIAPALGAAINKYEIHWQYLRVADVNAWLESTGNPRRIQPPKETPAPSASAPAVAAPVPVAPPAEAVPVLGAGDNETPEERDARRLREFLALGGLVTVSGGVAVLKGKQGALQRLADRERDAGRPRSDRSDIGKKLKAEALRQHTERA